MESESGPLGGNNLLCRPESNRDCLSSRQVKFARSQRPQLCNRVLSPYHRLDVKSRRRRGSGKLRIHRNERHRENIFSMSFLREAEVDYDCRCATIGTAMSARPR